MKDLVMTINTAEYRPCYVDTGTEGRKALFHRWIDKEKVLLHFGNYFTYEERTKVYREYTLCGILPAGVKAEKITGVVGLVEYDNGKIAEVEPTKIRFADDKIKDYAF